MRKLSILFCIYPWLLYTQTIRECKKRFDTYLNFKGSLNARLRFDEDAIYLMNAGGKEELAIYGSEILLIADLLAQGTLKDMEAFFKWKGVCRLNQQQRDSLTNNLSAPRVLHAPSKQQPLKGYRIAIDAGHMITHLQDAAIEQKFLYFARDGVSHKGDSVKLFESALTYNTARQLQAMLEERGANVMLTRDQDDHSSFNCTYRDWLKNSKATTLDSLEKAGLITSARHLQLLKLSDYKLFWEFFRDYDLINRANKINNFAPDVSVIIHYNVDETNAPWKKTTKKDFTMAFIGGAFTGDNLNKAEGKINFLKLLLTRQLNLSEKLAGETVSNFNRNLNVPVATSRDALYLRDNCLATPSKGVFSRNLVLCRRINSPLVYGESLYQDNAAESEQLMKSDIEVYGIRTNTRLNIVAKAYYNAVLNFLSTP